MFRYIINYLRDGPEMALPLGADRTSSFLQELKNEANFYQLEVMTNHLWS